MCHIVYQYVFVSVWDHEYVSVCLSHVFVHVCETECLSCVCLSQCVSITLFVSMCHCVCVWVCHHASAWFEHAHIWL